MIDGRRILAVITARGGSKGLPGKNVRTLAGKPLVAWTVEAALGSRYIDRTVVSSDSDEILAVARDIDPQTPLRRPPELAGDVSAQEDAVLHAMDAVEAENGPYDYVTLLAPTNPLRDSADIDASIEYLHGHPSARSVMTVMPCEHSPLHAGVLPPDGSLANLMPEELRRKNRQELPTYHRISGSVCVAECAHFRAERSFLTSAAYAVVTSNRNGLDIDSLPDFLLAELYLTDPRLAG